MPVGIQLNWQVQASFPIRKSESEESSPSDGTRQSKSDSEQPQPERKDSFKIGFQFVNVSHPSEARDKSSKSTIRSHVARVQHSRLQVSASVSTSTANKKTRPRKQTKRKQVHKESSTSTEELDEEFKALEPPATGPSGQSKTISEADEDIVDISNAVTRKIQSSTPSPKTRTVMLSRILRGGRHDPFWTYPVPFDPFLEQVVDHCTSAFSSFLSLFSLASITWSYQMLDWTPWSFYALRYRLLTQAPDLVNIAVDIPNIDSAEERGLLRKQWFPLCMTDPATFYAVMLMAASHLAVMNATMAQAINLMVLKGRAIQAINHALQNPLRATSDQLVGACHEDGSVRGNLW